MRYFVIFLLCFSWSHVCCAGENFELKASDFQVRRSSSFVLERKESESKSNESVVGRFNEAQGFGKLNGYPLPIYLYGAHASALEAQRFFEEDKMYQHLSPASCVLFQEASQHFSYAVRDLITVMLDARSAYASYLTSQVQFAFRHEICKELLRLHDLYEKVVPKEPAMVPSAQRAWIFLHDALLPVCEQRIAKGHRVYVNLREGIDRGIKALWRLSDAIVIERTVTQALHQFVVAKKALEKDPAELEHFVEIERRFETAQQVFKSLELTPVSPAERTRAPRTQVQLALVPSDELKEASDDNKKQNSAPPVVVNNRAPEDACCAIS